MSVRPTVVVTGISGNLGQRLWPMLSDFSVVGVDIREPGGSYPHRFERLDFGQESSCHALVNLLDATHAVAVVHLAFVIDPVRTGILDCERMWQINVAGTARVMEAITEVNRRRDGVVTKFIFPSSVSAYGPELPHPVTEDHPLGAHTLPYAIHKHEADEVVRFRAPSLGNCTAFILRPHIFAGASMDNYLIGALRGSVGGRGRLADRLRLRGTRLPLVLPTGDEYLTRRFQFLHVDDMARLIACILRRPSPPPSDEHDPVILNVAGRGDPITIHLAARIAGQRIVRLPSRALCRLALQLLWSLGVSSVPPEALPYMIGSYLMDTRRLRAFLASEYEHVIRYTSEQALADSFHPAAQPEVAEPATAAK